VAIGEALLDKYVLPFEIASVILLAAMVGAIVLVRED
jgi:NADH:ubiquinone oxidoreductase subunit 6 (subunit J)